MKFIHTILCNTSWISAAAKFVSIKSTHTQRQTDTHFLKLVKSCSRPLKRIIRRKLPSLMAASNNLILPSTASNRKIHLCIFTMTYIHFMNLMQFIRYHLPSFQVLEFKTVGKSSPQENFRFCNSPDDLPPAVIKRRSWNSFCNFDNIITFNDIKCFTFVSRIVFIFIPVGCTWSLG